MLIFQPQENVLMFIKLTNRWLTFRIVDAYRPHGRRSQPTRCTATMKRIDRQRLYVPAVTYVLHRRYCIGCNDRGGARLV